MAESRNNLRTNVVVTLACLTCIFLGYLMGLAAKRPEYSIRKAAGAEQAERVIRPAAVVDAKEFKDVSYDILNHPDAHHNYVQGMPLKMVMMKFTKILSREMTKHEMAQLEKKMADVNEAIFSSFSDVPQDDVDRFKIQISPLLDFRSPDSDTSQDLDCIFGVSADGGATLSEIVLILSHPDLQIVRFAGKMDPSVMELLTGKKL